MFNYIVRRLILLPITLFFIILVNFVIINLAPGEPVSLSDISADGLSRKDNVSMAFGGDMRYLQFREFYGLTLPILWNNWPRTSEFEVNKILWQLVHRKSSVNSTEEMAFSQYDALRIELGDKARFIMPTLIKIISDPTTDAPTLKMAVRFFVRGGTRQALLGSGLTEEQRAENDTIAKDNLFLSRQLILPTDTEVEITKKREALVEWYQEHAVANHYEMTPQEKLSTFFFETRFFKYMSRVVRLDFGTLRNDDQKTVVSEVVKRFKYSLTLSVIPMFVTFFLCVLLGITMAYYQNSWIDYSLNLICLVLYAIPIFVVAPFLIVKIGLNHTFPFTDIPIPIQGFSSPEIDYENMTSWERFWDIARHLFLPLIAITYGGLAAQARLSRTTMLEVMKQDYVRTAKAKGVPTDQILIRHVGRNAAITLVTAVAGSLGVVLGGSLIAETLFNINGFGKFFYDAVVNRDYNVTLFSALAGSFLTLVGYLIADIAYTVLDPRVSLEEKGY